MLNKNFINYPSLTVHHFFYNHLVCLHDNVKTVWNWTSFLLHTFVNGLIKKLIKLYVHINTHRTEWRKTNYNYQLNFFGFTFSYTLILDDKCNKILIYNINTSINS